MPTGPGSLIDGVWKYGETDLTGPLFSDFLNLLGDSIRASRGDTGWLNLTLTGGWSSVASEPVQYRRINGIVYLKGIATGGIDNIGTLPAGFRPQRGIRSQVPSSSSSTATVRVLIGPSGTISGLVDTQPNLAGFSSFPADL